MRLESRLYRTVQAERAVRGEHEQYGCPDAHENAHASDLHDMELMEPKATAAGSHGRPLSGRGLQGG